VADFSLNHTISDRFCYDLLSLFDRLKAKLQHDVLQMDAGVGDVDLFQTELDNSVL